MPEFYPVHPSAVNLVSDDPETSGTEHFLTDEQFIEFISILYTELFEPMLEELIQEGIDLTSLASFGTIERMVSIEEIVNNRKIKIVKGR